METVKLIVAKAVIVVETEIEIPKECPECKADLTEDGQLHEYVLAETGFNGNLFESKKKDEQGFDTGEPEQFADYETAIPTGYKCNNCEHEFHERVEVEYSEDSDEDLDEEAAES